MTIFIYGLTDPRNDVVRYVGQTVNVISRLRLHARANNAVACWLAELAALGMKPKIKILARTDSANEAWSLENEHIDFYRAESGALFLNRAWVKGGGDVSESRPGRPKSSVLVRVNFALHPDDLAAIERIQRREKTSMVGALRHALTKDAGK